MFFNSCAANVFNSVKSTPSTFIFFKASSTFLYLVLARDLKACKSLVKVFWNKLPNAPSPAFTLYILRKSSSPDCAIVLAPSLAYLNEPPPIKLLSATFSKISIVWPFCKSPGVNCPTFTESCTCWE